MKLLRGKPPTPIAYANACHDAGGVFEGTLRGVRLRFVQFKIRNYLSLTLSAHENQMTRLFVEALGIRLWRIHHSVTFPENHCRLNFAHQIVLTIQGVTHRASHNEGAPIVA
jgi:hypothetical protein